MIASTLSISSPDQRFSDEETRAHLGFVHGAVHETRWDMLRQGTCANLAANNRCVGDTAARPSRPA